VVPRLNTFGLAFQANAFHWPGAIPKARQWWQLLPFSGLATASSVHNSSTGFDDTGFRTFELLAASGFTLGRQQFGGFFVDETLINGGGPAGDLGDAYVTLPVPVGLGHYAVTAGQFTPMMYQYDPINRLAQALPGALATAVGAFSFTDPTPAIRLDYFDHRSSGTADGVYANLGVPFQGHLSATRDAQVNGARGVFGQVFRRWGLSSLGVFGYLHNSNRRLGILANRDIGKHVQLSGIGSLGHDQFGDHEEFTADADFLFNSSLALTGRLEALGGQEQDFYPVGAVTYYPFHQHLVRLNAQGILAKGNHSFSLFAIGQL